MTAELRARRSLDSRLAIWTEFSACAWLLLIIENCWVPSAFRFWLDRLKMWAVVSAEICTLDSEPTWSEPSAFSCVVDSVRIALVDRARMSDDSIAAICFESRVLIPSVEIAPTWAEVNAMICAVLNAAQSSEVKPAIDLVDRPAIWAVLSAEMMEAMDSVLVLLDSADPNGRAEPLAGGFNDKRQRGDRVQQISFRGVSGSLPRANAADTEIPSSHSVGNIGPIEEALKVDLRLQTCAVRCLATRIRTADSAPRSDKSLSWHACAKRNVQ
jgi:hypothetical protein